MRIWMSFLFLLSSSVAFSAEEHKAIKRIVVFPLQVEVEYRGLAEEVWWNLRAKLTENKRFLVASRNFMEAKGVFQSRGQLESSDAIILGRLLDAHALVTVGLTDRRLSLRAYEGRKGYLLQERTIELHPSLPLSKQLPNMSERLVLDFLASIPYQGVVVTDNLVGRAVYKNGEKYRIKAEVGTNVRVTIGDLVQLVDLQVVSLESAFGKGGELKVLAEGKVAEVKDQTIFVDLDRISELSLLKEGTLIQIPNEYKRLQETYAMGSVVALPELPLTDSTRVLSTDEKQKKPLVTSLSFLANLVIMLIVAL